MGVSASNTRFNTCMSNTRSKPERYANQVSFVFEKAAVRPPSITSVLHARVLGQATGYLQILGNT